MIKEQGIGQLGFLEYLSSVLKVFSAFESDCPRGDNDVERYGRSRKQHLLPSLVHTDGAFYKLKKICKNFVGGGKKCNLTENLNAHPSNVNVQKYINNNKNN